MLERWVSKRVVKRVIVRRLKAAGDESAAEVDGVQPLDERRLNVFGVGASNALIFGVQQIWTSGPFATAVLVTAIGLGVTAPVLDPRFRAGSVPRYAWRRTIGMDRESALALERDWVEARAEYDDRQ